MNLHTLKPAIGSTKSEKRIGRGSGSGMGGTSTRGHKGAQSRSGYSRKAGFEGGQMPLQRRVPKFGFKNPGKITFKVLNLDDLQKLSEGHSTTTLDLNFFIQHGLVSKNDRIKVLGRGEISKNVAVTAHAFSDTAKESIEKAGGSTNLVTK
jgi:large subunit ribosomal protein L15